MFEAIMELATGLAAIASLLAGAYYGWKAQYQEATFYLVSFLCFSEMLK